MTVFHLFVALPGVNLLVGTESGLMLLDRSGQGKVYPLINRRRIQQMDVLEGLNVLVTISGMLHVLPLVAEHEQCFFFFYNAEVMTKVWMTGGWIYSLDD